MKKTSIIRLLVILTVLPSITGMISGQGWNQWMGPERNGKITGFKAPASWPPQLTTDWNLTIGTGDASPVAEGGNIFAFSREGSDEVIRCVDLASGREIWKNSYPAVAVTGPAQSHPGPRSTPVVTGGKVITFGVGGTLSCFDAASGKKLWSIENPDLGYPQFFTGMSPLVAGNLCIIHLGTRDKGELVAVDIATGEVRWKWNGEGPAYGSPVLMNTGGVQMAVLLTEKSITGVGLGDGKIEWQVPTVILNRFYNAASPVVSGNIIYFTGQGSGTRAIRITGKQGSFNATELWNNPALGTKWNTPVLKNGFLYGLSDQRKLFCINAETGETAWIDETVNHDFGTVADAGPAMVALPASANLIFYKPGSSGYSEIIRYKVSETPVFTFPLLAGNRILIKDANNLICYRLE